MADASIVGRDCGVGESKSARLAANKATNLERQSSSRSTHCLCGPWRLHHLLRLQDSHSIIVTEPAPSPAATMNDFCLTASPFRPPLDINRRWILRRRYSKHQLLHRLSASLALPTSRSRRIAPGRGSRVLDSRVIVLTKFPFISSSLHLFGVQHHDGGNLGWRPTPLSHINPLPTWYLCK